MRMMSLGEECRRRRRGGGYRGELRKTKRSSGGDARWKFRIS
jgi:hypothetical protein